MSTERDGHISGGSEFWLWTRAKLWMFAGWLAFVAAMTAGVVALATWRTNPMVCGLAVIGSPALLWSSARLWNRGFKLWMAWWKL